MNERKLQGANRIFQPHLRIFHCISFQLHLFHEQLVAAGQ